MPKIIDDDKMSVLGPWKEGLVLDKHIKTSLYLGNNEYGHPDFDTTRSELGEFIYDIKYNYTYINKLSNKEILPMDLYERFIKITEKEIKDFIEGKDINYLIGAPSSIDRKIEPVHVISTFISYMMSIPYIQNALFKTTSNPSKNMSYQEKQKLSKEILINDFELVNKKLKNKNVLIIDDLYQSGETLKACTVVIEKVKQIGNIYVLAMTKTKY